MAVNLPTELLRSFVAIVDSGSMLRATDLVFVTQSALSLQMKRLEEITQTLLFHRDGRRLSLTPSGQTLLAYARDLLALNDRAVQALNGDALPGPVRVGLVQDFAETLLSGVLAQFSALNPDTQLQVRVAGTLELLELLGSDRLDVLLGMGPEDDAAGVKTVQAHWLGDLNLAQEEVLPLAVLESPCRFRDAALSALTASGRKFRIALETPNLSALRAAIDSNLAVGCRTEIFSDRIVPQDLAPSLPSLPKVSYVLRTRPEPHPAIEKLAELIKTAVTEG